MTSRMTVANVAGCELSEAGDRVIVSVSNRRGQAVDLSFDSGAFVELVPLLVATAAAASKRRKSRSTAADPVSVNPAA
jgi:hypothetical protein